MCTAFAVYPHFPSKPTRLTCENELNGLPGLPDGWPCNRDAEFICEFCGIRCASCLAEFPCSTPDGIHVNALELLSPVKAVRQ